MKQQLLFGVKELVIGSEIQDDYYKDRLYKKKKKKQGQ